MLPCLFSAVFSAFKDKSILLVISLDIKTNEVTLNLKDCLKIPKKKSPEKGVAATSLKVKMLDCFMGAFILGISAGVLGDGSNSSSMTLGSHGVTIL